jgi:uncharacterized membrane protein YdbT with pleckstrin-like domain
MSYIDKNLITDERILFRTKKHIIVFFYPVVLTIFSFFASDYMQSNLVLAKFQWAPWLVTLIFWLYVWLEYATSEYAVTNKRVMMREGFFHRHANEMRLSAISQVTVDQSLVGQLLNYGVVTINAFGAFDSFSKISHPAAFQKYVNEQGDKVTR